MLFGQFIVILIILAVSHAGDYNNIEEEHHKGSPCDVNIMTTLKNEILKLNDANTKILQSLEVINHKLDASEKKMDDKLYDLENKFNTCQMKNHEFKEKREERIHKDLYIEEKRTKEKLDEYTEKKLDSLENQIFKKTDELEELAADKSDINVINHKLDARKTNQANMEENNITVSETIAKTAPEKTNDDITQKLNDILEKISESENVTSHIIFDEFNKKFMNLEENFNRKWAELKKMITGTEESVKYELDMLNKTIPEQLEEHINFKFDTIENNIILNISSISNTMNNTITQDIQRIEEQCIINKNKTGVSDCKERVVSGDTFDLISMDSTLVNHFVYDDASGATYFKTYFAVKSTKGARIMLSLKLNPGYYDDYFVVDIGNGGYSGIRSIMQLPEVKNYENSLHNVSTPDILSSTRYVPFYLKIRKGNLELGKVGDLPFLKYADDDLKTVECIGFNGLDDTEITYLYDCPPHFEETLGTKNDITNNNII